MEIKTEIKRFIVDQICDTCKIGKMRPTGSIIESVHLYYNHKCDKCISEASYIKEYPYEEVQLIVDSM